MEKPSRLTEKVTVPNDLAFAEVTALLAKGKTVTLRAKGNSMYPFIQEERDEIVLERCTEIQKGEIVLVRLATGQYVLHRIIRAENENIWLMGDGNVHASETCKRTDIAGKVTCILRKGKPKYCNSACERQKALLWLRLLPIRRYLLAAFRVINRLKISK